MQYCSLQHWTLLSPPDPSTAGRCIHIYDRWFIIEYISERNILIIEYSSERKELSFSLVIGVARFCLFTFQTLYLLHHRNSRISMLGPVNRASTMIWLLDSASYILTLNESTQVDGSFYIEMVNKNLTKPGSDSRPHKYTSGNPN